MRYVDTIDTMYTIYFDYHLTEDLPQNQRTQ